MNTHKPHQMGKQFRQQTWDALVEDDCRQLIRLAVREDLDQGYDWTTVSLVPEESTGSATIVTRESGTVAGLVTVPVVLDELECNLSWAHASSDGDQVEAGTALGKLRGSARDLLTAERLLLNLIGHLSGIATLTHRYVERVRETGAEVYDTRKTHPAYRRLEKYAVRCGGGRNHRGGLYDAILIKDNHLAFGSDQGNPTPAKAIETAREFVAKTLPEQADRMIIEIEVDTLEQFRNVLPCQPDIVLLDNMAPEVLRTAVQLRDERGATAQLEASGGVSLETILAIAESGVDRISVGALTHSARCLDVGLDWNA